VPFSDPLADGLVNQLAAQRGLESGTTPPKLLETIAAIRSNRRSDCHLHLFQSHPFRVGNEKIHYRRAKAGVDGLLVLDCLRKNRTIRALMKQAGLCHIYLVAPTTPEDRIGTHRQARQRNLFITFRAKA